MQNLEEALKLNVNIYELENSILSGDSKFTTHDHTLFIMKSESGEFRSYEVNQNEVLLNDSEGVSYLIKKV